MRLEPDFRGMEEGKVLDAVFDKKTLLVLHAFVHDKIISGVGGPISTGKEAHVFKSNSPEGKLLAIKVYMVETCNYNKMFSYLQGDSRFEKIKKTKKGIVYAFCAKEYRNLQRLFEVGIKCPRPLAYKNNVLVFDFIGDEDNNPAPRLKDYPPKDAETAQLYYDALMLTMKKMYKEAGLVHGDLSEYNLLVFDNELWVIDVSQAVLTSHPEALTYLRRDIHNVNNYFKKKGAKTKSEEELFSNLTKE